MSKHKSYLDFAVGVFTKRGVKKMSESKEQKDQPDLSALLSFENATHELKCRHAIGANGKVYYMQCHVLKTLPNKRLKIQVYGDRYWKGAHHIVKTRYVEACRVFER